VIGVEIFKGLLSYSAGPVSIKGVYWAGHPSPKHGINILKGVLVNIGVETMADFWNGSEPCWDFLECPENIYSRCPAYHHRDKPCWEQATTQCRKVLDFEWQCGDCKVFKVYSPSGIYRQPPLAGRRWRRIFFPKMLNGRISIHAMPAEHLRRNDDRRR
jgi:hypothetical protein